MTFEEAALKARVFAVAHTHEVVSPITSMRHPDFPITIRQTICVDSTANGNGPLLGGDAVICFTRVPTNVVGLLCAYPFTYVRPKPWVAHSTKTRHQPRRLIL